MAYYPNDQDVTMVQQDFMAYGEPSMSPYAQEAGTSQLFQPSMPFMQDQLFQPSMPYVQEAAASQLFQPSMLTTPHIADTAQLSTEDWWLWSDFQYCNPGKAPLQDHFYRSAGPEPAVPFNAHDRIDQLSQKIIELERKLSRLDDLDVQCKQLQQAEQRLGHIEVIQQRLCQVELSTENHYIKSVPRAYRPQNY
jgi:hypothetical protein